MSGRTDLILAVIALAVVAMAIVQVGVLVATGLLVRRVTRMADQFEQDLRPMLGHLNAIARDGARAAALATTQMERADALFADAARRITQTMDIIQTTLLRPAREAGAFIEAFRAGLRVIRDLRGRGRRGRSDDEDALFI